MKPPSRLLRAIRLLAVLVQLAVPGLGIVADAHLEQESRAQSVHIESQNHDCDARHHPVDCAICQFIRTPAVLASASQLPLAASVAAVASLPADLSPAIQPAPLPLPRGPPLFS